MTSTYLELKEGPVDLPLGDRWNIHSYMKSPAVLEVRDRMKMDEIDERPVAGGGKQKS